MTAPLLKISKFNEARSRRGTFCKPNPIYLTIRCRKRSAAKQINNHHFNLEHINRSSLLALQGSLERLFFFVEVVPRNPHFHVMRIPECEKFLLVESGLLGFGLRNTAEVLRIPDNNWNPESKFHLKLIRNPVFGVPSPERRIQNPRQSWIT